MNKFINKLTHRFKVKHNKIFYISDVREIIDIKAKTDILISGVTFDNVHRIADFRPIGFLKQYRGFLEEGQGGIYAWSGSKIAGNAWATICRKPHCRGNGYLDIYKGEALIHHCNVFEEYRGQGIYPAMLSALCRRLFSQKGITRIIIDTALDNKSSLSGISKAGFKPIGIGHYIQFECRFGEYLLFSHFKSLDKALMLERKNFY